MRDRAVGARHAVRERAVDAVHRRRSIRRERAEDDHLAAAERALLVFVRAVSVGHATDHDGIAACLSGSWRGRWGGVLSA